MESNKDTAQRKKDHIDICLNEDVGYNYSNGFDNYVFQHNPITEVVFSDISLSTKFFGTEINYPFIISCMTGGTGEAKSINRSLAEAAAELNIPIGVGSQRQMLENTEYLESFSIFKNIAADIPVLSNIGAAQVSKMKSVDPLNRIMEAVDADVLVIHCNPLQEMLQRGGEPDFNGLLNSIEAITNKIDKPVIVKEVGSGIDKESAKKILDAGVKGIDVAGSGGTSWGAVELIRNKHGDDYFRNWGMPTSYCVRRVNELKSEYKFILVASGGINTFDDVAKSIALGADLTGTARTILKEYHIGGTDAVIKFVTDLFNNVKKIMYLTGCANVTDFQSVRLIKKEEMI